MSIVKDIVFYATDRGTAKELATEIGEKIGFGVYDLSIILCEHIPKVERLIFVVSTYDDGKPPKSCEAAWERIQNYHEQCPNLKFAVFAIGSSSFKNTFLGFGKALEQKLLELGGTKLADMGIRDVDGQIEGTNVDEWIKSLHIQQ